MTQPIEIRLRTLAHDGIPADQAAALLDEGCTHALQLDRERLALERAMDSLAERVEEPSAAQALRRAWMRHRNLNEELLRLRDMLRRVGELHSA
jgi:hypothetical protein